MLVNGLGSYLPECETIKESSSVRERLALHLSSEDNDVVVRQLSSGVVAIDFWDFDPEVYDNDGPTPEMARQKRAVAVEIVRTLVGGCGARFAYMSTASDKSVAEPGHLDFAARISDLLAKRDELEDALRRPYYFWLVAVARDDHNLGALVTRVLANWTPIGEMGDTLLWEAPDEHPVFMDADRQPKQTLTARTEFV